METLSFNRFPRKDQMFSIPHFTYIPRLFHYVCTDYRIYRGTKTGSNDGIPEQKTKASLREGIKDLA